MRCKMVYPNSDVDRICKKLIEEKVQTMGVVTMLKYLYKFCNDHECHQCPLSDIFTNGCPCCDLEEIMNYKDE